MKNDYYTYAYLRKNGTPYYIGKGRGNRAFSKQGRSLNLPPRSRILFLKKELTEEEAFKHEVYMIAVFGRKDLGTGILRNLTDGGEGSSNPCEETLKKMRDSHLGKTLPDAQKQKISEGGKKAWIRRRQRDPEGVAAIGERMRKLRKDEEVQERLSQSISRRWKVTFKDGNSVEIKNIHRWAKEKGYSPSLISSVSSGRIKFHKDIIAVEKLGR